MNKDEIKHGIKVKHKIHGIGIINLESENGLRQKRLEDFGIVYFIPDNKFEYNAYELMVDIEALTKVEG